MDRPRIEAVTPAGEAFETEFAAKLKEVTDAQQQHYLEQLKIARDRTADYLEHIATKTRTWPKRPCSFCR